MIPTIDMTATPIVASGLKHGPGDSQGIIASVKAPDYHHGITESPGVKKGYTSQDSLRSFHLQANAIAKSLRTDDKTLGKAERLLDKIEGPLQAIVKAYPPFPSGSEERVKMLKSFNSFRKMIDKLTIPAVKDSSSPDRTIGMESSSEGLPLLGSDFDAEQPSMPEEYLSIPILPEKADDEEIYNALEKINDAKATIFEIRERLFDKAARVKEMFHQEHPYMENITGKFRLEEADAQLKTSAEGLSRNIKKGLLANPAGYMHVNRSQMIGML